MRSARPGRALPLVARDEVIAVPVRGIFPSRLTVAARKDDKRPLVLAYLAAAREVRSTAAP
ncbi:hypothetical protein [Streptomyces sp. BPTC-684]|uniref:hypothetical protein n=1 Tax=Streptomyces sp. BPTC-684 TaxID=3043734 RepID=UPI0024B26890|nr:hypothetical protein [Streptomyces sp. BPTC-684]WHM40640.1 hypothetical protein QIY60_29730 [Streptomyces sp. BPTC-684]